MNEKIRDVAIIAGGILATALFLGMIYVILAEAVFLPAVMLLCLF